MILIHANFETLLECNDHIDRIERIELEVFAQKLIGTEVLVGNFELFAKSLVDVLDKLRSFN